MFFPKHFTNLTVGQSHISLFIFIASQGYINFILLEVHPYACFYIIALFVELYIHDALILNLQIIPLKMMKWSSLNVI